MMYRFLARRGLARLIGGRAVPALMLWDLAMLANRTRQMPIVDRTLRRGLTAGRRAALDLAGAPFSRRARSVSQAASDLVDGPD
jgi:hypothetical protein